MLRFILAIIVAIQLFGCTSDSKKSLKVAATPVPHAEILEAAKKELKDQGIDLVIIVTDDYNVPNRSLANREVDANFFQHTPYLEEQIKSFHYPIESIAKIEIEPMGIYSKKVKSLKDLKEGATIAIPNDPSNEARALHLLHVEGIIELDNPQNLLVTPHNIKKNPKNIKFIELDAAMLPRTLDDVDAAVINTNYALAAKLSPQKDALAIEPVNSPYANILVIHVGDEQRADIQALKAAMTSEKMREFILKKYKGAILPAF